MSHLEESSELNVMSEEEDLLSGELDGFLETPKTKVSTPIVKPPEGELSVLVEFQDTIKDYSLISIFSNLCLPKQQHTSVYNIALLVQAPGILPMRLGFCNEYVANTTVLRMCLLTEVACRVQRYDGVQWKELTEADLGKRSFLF